MHYQVSPYCTITATASRHILCSAISCLNLCLSTSKKIILANKVSCLALARAKNFLTSLECPGLVVDIFVGSPLMPESPIIRFPSGMECIRALGFEVLSFFFPPLNLTISLVLAKQMLTIPGRQVNLLSLARNTRDDLTWKGTINPHN